MKKNNWIMPIVPNQVSILVKNKAYKILVCGISKEKAVDYAELLKKTFMEKWQSYHNGKEGTK